MLTKAFVPYGGYYSTPFCRWQGAMQHENAIVMGATTARRWLVAKDYDPAMFEYLYFGMTVGQPEFFYGHTWSAAILADGKKDLPALMVNQACATAAACLHLAAVNIECGEHETVFALATDRCSNGPHTTWPNPQGPGGKMIAEDWVLDHFNRDPNAGLKMIQTAENVAREIGATREQCDDVALRRYEQYRGALKDDRAFQKRYMFPVEVKIPGNGTRLVEEDEGVTPTTHRGLARLKPVEPGGVHSRGAQTHPADGNCGLIVTTRERARALSLDPAITVQILSYGYARSRKGTMAAAPVPAAKMALEKAALKVSDITAFKTHNPFVINDIHMAEKLGIGVMEMNNYGSSLVYGHPQAPTAGRLMMELVEELVALGGGYGLWAGCAAGDTGAAMVIKVFADG